MANETNAEKALAVDIHDICMLHITIYMVSMCSIKQLLMFRFFT